MNLERFLSEREPDWIELDELVRRARGRPERLGPDGVRRLAGLYRAVAADLPFARRRFPDDPATTRLEGLVGRARATVYGVEARRETIRSFLSRGYWRRVAERPGALLLAWALLLVPAALAGGWGLSDPGAAAGLVPGEFRSALDPGEGRDFGSLAEGAAFSSQVLTNNIQVSFLAFGAGLLFGLGTAVVLTYNGAILGAVAGVAPGAGNGEAVLKLLSAHGPLELTCIVVTAAAGLRIGWAIVSPGRRGRGESLVREARRSIEIVLGTAPWLVLCGFAEGFLTGPGLALATSVGIGIVLFVLYWGLVVWRGRVPAPESPAG